MRNTTTILLLAFFAGIAGGVAVQLLFPPVEGLVSEVPERVEAAPDSGLREVADLRRQNRELHLAVDDLTHRLATLERSEEERGEAVAEMAPGATVIGPDGQPLPGRLGGIPVARRISIGGFGKVGELLALPEEERWAKAREDLSLDAYQESELRRIQEDLKNEMAEALKMDPETGMPSGQMDFAKLLKSRQEAEERVKNLLAPDQYQKYKQGGYGAALGTGSGMSFAFSTGSFRRPEDK